MNSARRVPDFFIVGQAKSGTTALYEMLRSHPEIFMSNPKEPEFLASDMRRRFRPPMAGELPTTLDEYLALFVEARVDQRAGEASAFYLSSHTAASAIAQLNPDAQVIAIFREPTSFLRSLHLQLLQNHIEDERDLRSAMNLQVRRREGKNIPLRSYRPQVLQYSQHIRYTEQLERYHDALPSDQVLVLIYEELKCDNAATVRAILQFLGVDDSAPVTPVHANPTVTLRSQALDEAVHRFSVGRDPFSRAVKMGAKSVMPKPLRRRLLHTVQDRIVHMPPPTPDEELMRELRAQVKPEVERFSSYLGRDLTVLWGYGDF